MSLLVDLRAAKEWLAETDGDVELKDAAEEAYWKSATTRLSTTLAIAHQAAEFYIKGRIAEISPFLLLSSNVRDWPKVDADGNTSFSRLRTIDAQDLVRLHDRCSMSPLNEDFKAQLENIRVRRNSIMHTVGTGLAVKVNELVKSILGVHENLMGAEWLDFRRAALDQSSASKLYSEIERWSDAHLVQEYLVVEAILSAAELEKFFGLPAGQRRYICPQCTWDTFADSDILVNSAVLLPNTPGSTNTRCPLCNAHQPVFRRDCERVGCPGNVISDDWIKCLTCGSSQTDPAE